MTEKNEKRPELNLVVNNSTDPASSKPAASEDHTIRFDATDSRLERPKPIVPLERMEPNAEGKSAAAPSATKQPAKQKDAAVKTDTKKTSVKKKRKGKIPLALLIPMKVLRFFLVPVLCVVALYIGLRVGYVNIGGQNPQEILEIETWKHMLDLIFSET